jgi:hypothetical protein
MEIKLKPELVLKSRISILNEVVSELLIGFGAGANALEIARKGILEQQILKTVTILYLNSSNKLVGRVIIKIDWKNHHIFAETDEGKNFEVLSDKSKSIKDQLSDIFSILVEHTEKLRAAFGSLKVVTQYTYVQEVYEDQQKLNLVRNFLKLSPSAEDYEWSVSSGADFDIEFISDNLKELEIICEYIKPK